MGTPLSMPLSRRAAMVMWSFLLGVAFLAHAQSAQQSKHIMGLHLAHPTMYADEALASQVPDGYMLIPRPEGDGGQLLIASVPFLTNADFSEISAGLDEITREPVINFTLTPEAAKIFAEVTRANIGTAIAIVADGAVISAPVITSEISGGRGIITGSFSTKDVEDMVARMRTAKSD